MTGPVSLRGAVRIGLAGLAVTLFLSVQVDMSAQQRVAASAGQSSATLSQRQFLDRYCATCHNERLKTGGLSLDRVDVSRPDAQPEVWEKVVRKLRTGVMPPPNMLQPPKADRLALLTWLETSLDSASAAKPNPGRTETLRRLNRTEYQNAIRDLLALDIDAASLLPADESGRGFDNVIVGDLSPTLLDRYISAAQKISSLAVGRTQSSLQNNIIRLPADLSQEEQMPGLPIGTRGGVSVPYTFPQDGEYDIQIWLARDLAGSVGGLREQLPHELLVLVDRERVGSFTIKKPATPDDDTTLDKNLKLRVPVHAGPHNLGVTFVKEGSSLIETARQPTQSRFNERRHPRTGPAISQVSVTGPYGAKGAAEREPDRAKPQEDTPSRRRLFVCRPTAQQEDAKRKRDSAQQEENCAREILSTLVRRAYRRPIAKAEVDEPMAFYREGRAEGDFDAGIERALSAVLINPDFLFRVESEPKDLKRVAASGVYRISDLELASRLSFFLWSSVPDDELLDAAVRGKLSQPGELERQTRRMLADRRSFNLATNFAGQWLRLRNIEAVTPNNAIYRDFDDNLRQAFRQETELFFDSVLREDRSVLNLIRADYTFLNERLAKHYGIPNVYGSRFRRVTLAPESHRGGLLRQGSVLAVTSYATRTSPVLRGVFVLKNVFGAPPAPPPPNVPALDESNVAANLPMRERMAAHRSNAVCASCHRTIDPVGFALENFNAVGQWREADADGQPVDPSAALPGAGEFRGIDGLEDALLSRPELFAGTLTEHLLTFALGRGVEYYDAPAVRKIVRDAEKDGYRFSSLILGIVKSVPFQMRSTRINEASVASK
jgi:mono/diheme cytochrome c family protein